MPPRLSMRSLAAALPSTTAITTNPSSIPTFLLPFLTQLQTRRHASILSSLTNLKTSYNTRIRVGRGPSSRKGGKSGRGHKGQKQKGKAPADFAGGQTPDAIVHGKYGFKNSVHGVEMSGINLDTIQSWIDQGRLDSGKVITLNELCSSRALHGIKDGVKLLGRGREGLKSKIDLVVSRASKSAVEAVEALGGTVTTRFYTKSAIRRIRQGEMHPFVSLKWDQRGIGKEGLMVKGAETEEARVKGKMGFEYRLPDPSGRRDLEYYRSEENRGYLAHTVKEGHSSSLYFLSEQQVEEGRRAAEERRKLEGGGRRKMGEKENRLW